jgi:hypothetical protein
MTTIYLNQKNRQIILNYIIDKVKKDFETTKIAKEIEEIKVKLIDYLRKEIEINFPVEDMKILEQYGLTKEYNLISIDVNFKRNCIYICLYSSFKTFKESVQLDFSPPLILIEDEYKIMRFLKNLVEDNKLIKDIIIKCAKLQCDYVSDIRKIIVAYDNRLNSKRTLKSLFKSYPKMKKLIDKEIIDQIKSSSEKNDKIK